jgi:hypothetical protein
MYNIYIFGASLEDTGNLKDIYDKNNTNISIGLCKKLGPLNRFSDGYVYIDYISKKLNKKILNMININNKCIKEENNIYNNNDFNYQKINIKNHDYKKIIINNKCLNNNIISHNLNYSQPMTNKYNYKYNDECDKNNFCINHNKNHLCINHNKNHLCINDNINNNECHKNNIIYQNNIINFSIGGAIVNGNINNNDINNNIIGHNGYVSQIDMFEKYVDILYNINNKDIFIYSSVGGNDISYIASQDNKDFFISKFIDLHINNITRLYNNGCKQLLLIYIDPESIEYLPFVIKQNNTRITSELIELQKRIITDGLLPKLYNIINNKLTSLNLTLIPVSPILKNFINNPIINGIRLPIYNKLPLPTMCDLINNNNDIYPFNTIFYDDLHLTQLTYKKFSNYILNFFNY